MQSFRKSNNNSKFSGSHSTHLKVPERSPEVPKEVASHVANWRSVLNELFVKLTTREVKTELSDSDLGDFILLFKQQKVSLASFLSPTDIDKMLECFYQLMVRTKIDDIKIKTLTQCLKHLLYKEQMDEEKNIEMVSTGITKEYPKNIIRICLAFSIQFQAFGKHSEAMGYACWALQLAQETKTDTMAAVERITIIENDFIVTHLRTWYLQVKDIINQQLKDLSQEYKKNLDEEKKLAKKNYLIKIKKLLSELDQGIQTLRHYNLNAEADVLQQTIKPYRATITDALKGWLWVASQKEIDPFNQFNEAVGTLMSLAELMAHYGDSQIGYEWCEDIRN
ncbi:MAG: hypothetical protein WBE18_00285, partial [Gammaproteobacteria bacterium]